MNETTENLTEAQQVGVALNEQKENCERRAENLEKRAAELRDHAERYLMEAAGCDRDAAILQQAANIIAAAGAASG